MGGRGSYSGMGTRVTPSTEFKFNDGNVKKIIFKRDNGMTFTFEKIGQKNSKPQYRVERSDGMVMESSGNDLLWRVAKTTARNGGYVKYE